MTASAIRLATSATWETAPTPLTDVLVAVPPLPTYCKPVETDVLVATPPLTTCWAPALSTLVPLAAPETTWLPPLLTVVPIAVPPCITSWL